MSDFITFGRTKVYFINDLFEIDSGIVDVVNYVNLGGKESPNDEFVIRYKIKNTQNEYKHIELPREEIRFDLCEIKDLLIERLKEHITYNNEGKFNIINIDNLSEEDDIYGYLYKSDADIFKDNCIITKTTVKNKLSIIEDEDGNVVISDVKKAILDFKIEDIDLSPVDVDTQYKLILKINDKIYDTSIEEANIFNKELDNIEVDFNNCIELEYPEDYDKYQLTVTDIPEEYIGARAFFDLKFGDKSVSFSPTFHVEPIDINNKSQINLLCSHFIEKEDNNIYVVFDQLDLEYNLIQYWIPEKNKHYTLYLKFDKLGKIKTYKYNDYIMYEDLTDELPITFASFKEVE